MNANRNLKYIGSIIICLSCIGIFVSCQKHNTLKQAERFIHTQINCETFKKADGDEALIKEIFLEFFEEEAYQEYLDDLFGYMYPQLFYITNAEEVKIQEIKCKKATRQSDDSNTYQFEVKYTIISKKQKGEEVNHISMKDILEIAVNKENKLTKVIILNTSDTIKKLFLDVKVL